MVAVASCDASPVAQASPLYVVARSANAEPTLVQCRVIDHADNRSSVMQQRDQCAEGRLAGGERFGAVDRVDNPTPFVAVAVTVTITVTDAITVTVVVAVVADINMTTIPTFLADKTMRRMSR